MSNNHLETITSYLNKTDYKLHSDRYTLDFTDFYLHDPDAASTLIQNPTQLLSRFKDAIKQKSGKTLRIEVIKLPETETVRGVNHNHIGNMIQLEGIIISTSLPEQRMTAINYICLDCTNEHVIEQYDRFAHYLDKCPEPTCRSNRLRIQPVKCRFKQIQRAYIQEKQDAVPPGQLPRRFQLEFIEQLIESVKPGNRVIITGIIDAKQRKRNDPHPILKLYLKVNSVIEQSAEQSEIELTEFDQSQLKQLTQSKDYLHKIERSVAPNIYGYPIIKRALALQQCEGVSKNIYGERRRGQIHINIAGDPGVGKTLMLTSIAQLNPRSVQVAGRGSTAAGLTATVVKDEETGEWMLMAGAMVLSDRGILCADEAEKMRKEDREAMHPAMSSTQEVPINKAGINVKLNTRCSVLAACNPKSGRWDAYKTFTENINLPATLINRFDLIFIMKSNRTVEDEMKVAQFVTTLHTQSETLRPPIDQDTLRKLFVYARTITPQVSPEASEKLQQFYKQMYRASLEAQSIMITIRQMEGLIRMTEASAKLHLREVAIEEDADIAIQTLNESLIQSGIDPATGKIDVDIYQSGIPQSLREKLRRLVQVVRQLSKANIAGNYVSTETLTDWVIEHWNIPKSEVERLLEVADGDKVLYRPTIDTWAVT